MKENRKQGGCFKVQLSYLSQFNLPQKRAVIKNDKIAPSHLNKNTLKEAINNEQKHNMKEEENNKERQYFRRGSGKERIKA